MSKIIICHICGEKKEHRAKGLCKNCYQRYYVKEGRKDAHGRYGIHPRIKSLFDMEYCTVCHNASLGLQLNILHHIRPLCEGGSHEANNLIVLCPNCHKKIHNLMYLFPDEQRFRNALTLVDAIQDYNSLILGIQINNSSDSVDGNTSS